MQAGEQKTTLRWVAGWAVVTAMGVAGWGCGTSKKAEGAPGKKESAAAAPATFDRMERADFNRLAVELHEPLFWVADTNGNNVLDAAELAVIWHPSKRSLKDYVDANAFTPSFVTAYESMVKVKTSGHPPVEDTKEQARRSALLKELQQGRATLVSSDFSKGTDEEKSIVGHVLNAADIIERIHARQRGTLGMADQVPPDDKASQALFFRNQGPWCVAPATEKDENCSALPTRPPHASGLYPADIQAEKTFCEALSKHADQKTLMDPFVVVQKDGSGKLAAVPYNVAYKEDADAVSKELKAAADAITGAAEAPFKAYLIATAQAFLDNNWQPADEAWAKMNVSNSKWYLRIGPDEVYFEPCNAHAGFHVSFARINQDSLRWQQKLDPVKADMEKAVADLAGKPYKARNVSFHMPDFIDMVLNAGDSRAPHGATVGQSLPNWGPVANEGRGRTVAMINLYTDEDSKRALREQMESLTCATSMGSFVSEAEPQVMSTVLHEAAHNLGPSHEYKVKGKTAREIFGGPQASTLEELKAQTSALYFSDWLVQRNLITAEEAARAHTRDVAWAFGHISRGMYETDGKPKNYSHLASIQMGFLVKQGAVEWKPEEPAANGKDKGCFELHLDKWPAEVKKLGQKVLGIKASGDKKGADSLVREFVDDDGTWKTLRGTITERWLRSPKATFVYSVSL
jgi:hypothetical protein